MTNQVRIPKSLIDIHKPLMWDVFDNNGTLLASKGTVLSQVSSLIASGWGVPDLYYEAVKSSSEDFYNVAVRTYPINLTSFISGLAGDDITTQDGLFKDVDSSTTDHIDNIVAKVSQMLASYESSSLWAYKAVRLSQTLYYLFKQNTALLQIILFLRRYFNAQRYAGAQAVNRAFIAFRCSEVLKVSDEEGISLVCAALTCDLSVHKKIEEFSKQKEGLTVDQRSSLEGHAERSYAMLKAAQVVDTSWLFWVRMHHSKLHSANSGNKKNPLYILNDILQMADIIAARSSLRAGRDPLPLFNAVANVAFDENKKLTELGGYVIKALGVVPVGSLVDTAEGIGVVFGPDAIILLTNDKLDVKSNFKVQKYQLNSLADLKVRAPLCHKRLCGVLYIVLNQFADRATYEKQFSLSLPLTSSI